MAKRKPEEVTAVNSSPEELQVAHDHALTSVHNHSVVPDIAAARQRMQEDLRKKLRVTKEDVVLGIMDAIGDARILADPKAQIAGFREIGLLMGYYAPTKVDVTHSDNVRKVQERLQQLPDDKLQEMAGEDILDADFYEVRNG